VESRRKEPGKGGKKGGSIKKSKEAGAPQKKGVFVVEGEPHAAEKAIGWERSKAQCPS